MSNQSYRRVPQQEGSVPSVSGSSDSLEANVTRSRSERLQDKLVALAWVILAVLVARWTSFFHVLWGSDSVNRTLLRISALGFWTMVAMTLYLTVYLPKAKGLGDSSAWSVYCPRVIPSMAAIAIATYLIFLRATWPVWGFLAPLIAGTQAMGFLMLLHFVPSMGMC